MDRADYLGSGRMLLNGVRHDVTTIHRRFDSAQQVLMTVSDFRANLAHGVGHGFTPETCADELQIPGPSGGVSRAFCDAPGGQSTYIERITAKSTGQAALGAQR